jgi:hypothetical protein
MRRSRIFMLVVPLIFKCTVGSLWAQNLTGTANGVLTASLNFTSSPGTANTPTTRTVQFRVRCTNAAGYSIAVTAVCDVTTTAPADGGSTISASDIGVGITSIDISAASVIRPRTDAIASGFSYDPGAVTATNGLTPYTGHESGQATLGDIVDHANITILTGDRIANDESSSGTDNFLTVTMTFALLPQYFTPSVFTALVTMTITNRT